MQNREYYRAVSNGCRSRIFSKELKLKVIGPGRRKEGRRKGNTIGLYKMVAGQELQLKVTGHGSSAGLQHRGIQKREHYRAVSNGCKSRVFSKELQLKVTGHGCSTEGCGTGNTTGLYQMVAAIANQLPFPQTSENLCTLPYHLVYFS
jgi:hypothetical protein